MKCCFIRYLYATILSLFFLLKTVDMNAGIPPSNSASSQGLVSRIISITMHETKSGTTLDILGDGRISEYISTTLESPPRIVVDISCTTGLHGIAYVDSESSSLKSIRIGYHPKKIRLVLDIKGVDIPGFTIQSVDNGLSVSLLSDQKINNNIEEHETEDVVKARENPKENRPKKSSIENELIRSAVNDNRRDTAVFQKCLEYYKAKDWSGAIEKLERLIKTYPDGKYTEKAYFLLIKSYEKLSPRSISDQFNDIKNHYENTLNKFSESNYVPEALFSIGNIYFKIENYYEALGYYNLVVQKDKDSVWAAKALMNKVSILLLKEKREDALSVLTDLEDITSLFPEMPERIEAKKLKAKILYEMNRFHDSIDILNKLTQADPESIIKLPEISLYLGYNYYQLGDNIRSRKNLFRFYNSCPGREVNHLILTQIGDTYKNEGLLQDAAKIYRIVLERHPKTDGAIISRIRLAEQQEQEDFMAKTKKEIGSPKEIYKNIVNASTDTDEKNALLQLSSLKLAITYQKEKEYKKSLNLLKELQKKYPGTFMKQEMKHALFLTIESILAQEIKEKKYINVINFYLKEKELFLSVNAPELFLPVARAFNEINLEETATEIFKKADPLLSDREKPPDLLFFVGNYLFKIKQFKSALEKFEMLIDNYPSDRYVSDAYRLKGSILLKQKRYKPAAESFSSALRYPVTRCQKTVLLIEKAKALRGSNSGEKALKAIEEANGIKKDCSFSDYNICQEIGDLYLNLGYAGKAISFFNQAVDMATENSDKIYLKFKIAQCYLRLNKTTDCLALYNQISSLNDPFWSKLAEEKITEISFNKDINSEMLN